MLDSRQAELWQKLSAMQITPLDLELSFEKRLARENDWDLAFSLRVIFEYKRFVFLMLEAGHPVTPSDQVDQAWHLHLLYTRSYWDDLCGHIAGRSLHHGPTAGGRDEGQKYSDWYAKTKISYERLFGEKTPPEIWPADEIRFGDDVEFVRINRRRNLIIALPSRLRFVTRWFQR